MGIAIELQSASNSRPETAEHSRRMLHADQVRPLYQKIPTTAAGSIVAALVLICALWDLIPSRTLLLWFAAICVFQLGRLLQYLRFRRAPPPLEEMRRAGLVYAAGAFFSGCLWGSAGLVLFIPHSIADQALVFMVLWGMATAGVTALASYAPAFYAFTLPALLPIIVRTALEGGASHWFTAAVGLLFLAVTLVFGRNLNRLLTNCFCLTLEKADLVTELTAQKTAADLARQQAEVAHLIKSRLVEELTFEKAAAERARREAEAANRAKSQFLAAASHDLRQPLHALGLFAGALSERIRYPEVRNIVTNINASVEALETLFNEILDISKLDAGVVEPNFANFAIAEVLQRLRTGCEAEALAKGLKFRVRVCNAIVFSDAVLLERILRNLVGNAVRYTEKGAVLVACRPRGGKLRIEVRDSGTGIPPEQQERVFQEFYQLGNSERDRRKGLGLGLAIVRRLGRLLNCEITLNSRPGRGSVFAVQVPLGEEVSVTKSSPEKTDEAQPSFSGKSVVVIDDEAGVRESMRVLLTQWGFTVCVAGSTEEALELSQQAPPPDAIIADYRLRGDALGIEAIQALQARFRSNIPAVLVTGDTAPDRLREATASGFRLLHKPVAPAKLRSLLTLVLEERANVPD